MDLDGDEELEVDNDDERDRSLTPRQRGLIGGMSRREATDRSGGWGGVECTRKTFMRLYVIRR